MIIVYFRLGGTCLDIVFVLLIILIAAACGGEISARLGQTSILGKIIAGIIVGSAVFGWIQPTETIRYDVTWGSSAYPIDHWIRK